MVINASETNKRLELKALTTQYEFTTRHWLCRVVLPRKQEFITIGGRWVKPWNAVQSEIPERPIDGTVQCSAVQCSAVQWSGGRRVESEK